MFDFAGALAKGLSVKTTDMSALTWAELLGAHRGSKSGAAVNVDTALATSTVFACVRVLAEGVAMVPLKVYRENIETGRKVPARDLPVYKLLYRKPNDFMTSFELRETMMFHAVLCGDAIAIKNKVGGITRELLPVPPGCVTKRRMPDWSMEYDVADANGVIGTFTADQVVHLRGPSWDGYCGVDVVRLGREAIGLAIATEESHARMHANGVRPGGLLSVDAGLGQEARDRIKAALAEQREGLANAYKTLVLDKGATWTSMAMTGVDAQHLATRQFQIEEICRFMRVFPQMVGYSDKTATFASAEAFFLAHVIHSLQPWVERWEEVIARDLLDEYPADNDNELIARFQLQSLMRGDSAARAAYYTSGIVNGWLVRNEARRAEDLDPLPGLDEPLMPLNMATVTAANAAMKAVTDQVKAVLAKYGGSLANLDPDELEAKLGRVLSAANEHRIVTARDELNAVLAALEA